MAHAEVNSLIAGRYKLEQRLDAGGRAEVWQASDQELERPVSVKIIHIPQGSDPSLVEAFREEAQLEARLKHPGIVEVFDWGQDGDNNYVVMELLEGRTVEELLQDGPLPWESVVAVGRQAAAALVYAHSEGVAHGSIGAEHVMVAPDGRATLVDFGLQCRGECEYPALPDADTHALGALMYEMLLGASPTGPRPPDLPEQQAWPVSPHAARSDVPQELAGIVMKAIAPDPADRYATAAELLAALDELMRPKSRALLWTMLAVLAVLLVAIGTWFLTSQTKIVVPDVTGMSSAQAQSTLTSAGLELVVTGQEPSLNVAEGMVVSEQPPAGTKVRRGSQVGVTLSTGKPMSTVPAVAGTTFAAASSAIASAGLVVGTVTNQESTTFPADTVISQSPAAGLELAAGSPVDLVISAGEAQVTVPDVRGLSQANASAKLTNLGLVADVGTAYSSQPSGIVLTQGPAAGTVVPKGSTVTISVSKGPAPVKVPDVEGAQEADAKASLQRLGLVPVSVPTSGSPSEVGRVIRQRPAPGTTVAPGSQVRIFVGS